MWLSVGLKIKPMQNSDSVPATLSALHIIVIKSVLEYYTFVASTFQLNRIIVDNWHEPELVHVYLLRFKRKNRLAKWCVLTSYFSSAVRYCRGSTIRFIRCGSPSFSCTDVCLLSSTQHIVLNCRPCPNGTDVIESRMVIKYLAHCRCATIFGRPANLFSSHFRLYTTDHGRKCDNMKPPVTHSERFLFFSRQIFEYFVGLCIFVVFFFKSVIDLECICHF